MVTIVTSSSVRRRNNVDRIDDACEPNSTLRQSSIVASLAFAACLADAGELQASDVTTQQTDRPESEVTFVSPPYIYPVAACSSRLGIDALIPGGQVEVSSSLSDRPSISLTAAAAYELVSLPARFGLPGTTGAEEGETFSVTQTWGGRMGQSQRAVTAAASLPDPSVHPNDLYECISELAADGIRPGATVRFEYQTRATEGEPWPASWSTLETAVAGYPNGQSNRHRDAPTVRVRSTLHDPSQYLKNLARFRIVQTYCDATTTSSPAGIKSFDASAWATMVPGFEVEAFAHRSVTSGSSDLPLGTPLTESDFHFSNLIPHAHIVVHEKSQQEIQARQYNPEGEPYSVSANQFEQFSVWAESYGSLGHIYRTGMEVCAQHRVQRCDGTDVFGPPSTCRVIPMGPPPPSTSPVPPECDAVRAPVPVSPTIGDRALFFDGVHPSITRIYVFEERGSNVTLVANAGPGHVVPFRDGYTLPFGVNLIIAIDTDIPNCPRHPVSLRVVGVFRPLDFSLAPACAADPQWDQKFDDIFRYMAVVGKSEVFASCVISAVNGAQALSTYQEVDQVGPYVYCDGSIMDPVQFQSDPFSADVDGVLLIARTNNLIEVTCGGTENTAEVQPADIFGLGHGSTERITLGNQVFFEEPLHQCGIDDVGVDYDYRALAPSYQVDELAGILFHERTHTHGFRHGDAMSNQCSYGSGFVCPPSPTPRLCGGGTLESSTAMGCRANSVPEIAEACMSEIIERTATICAETRCPMGRTALVNALDASSGSACECVDHRRF